MADVEFRFTLEDFISARKLDKITITKRKQIESEVKDIVLTEVIEKIGEGVSPVTGRKFKKLSKDYLIKKEELGGTPEANLELFGDLKNSLRVKKKGDELILTVLSDQQPKADGHNNFSGKSSLPERKFIPNAKKGETFSRDIRDTIKSFIQTEIELEDI